MMEIRQLGKTGIEVGVVGLGCEGLLNKPASYYMQALDMMEAAGSNCIDLYSPNPDMRSNLGNALQGRREKFVLQGHLCAAWENGQYKAVRTLDATQTAFKDQLARLKTNYIDVGMIHYVDSEKTWDAVKTSGILAYAKNLQKDGIIRALGLSSHNPLIALQAIQEADIEVLMFSINPCYDLQPPDEDVEQLWNKEKYAGQLLNMDPDRSRLYRYCLEHGVGITVMKAFGGGDLLDADKSLAGMALSAHQAISYALDRPAVDTVLVGAHSVAELRQCLDYAESTAEERDYAEVLAKFPRISWQGHCMYCGHCSPCKAQIDIAMVTKLLNLAEAQKMVPETVREHYHALAHTAEECEECGICESRCPFEVKIRNNMARAKEIFS